jgi:hypothetical protein
VQAFEIVQYGPSVLFVGGELDMATCRSSNEPWPNALTRAVRPFGLPRTRGKAQDPSDALGMADTSPKIRTDSPAAMRG